MRKIILMAGAAMLMAAPAFAENPSIPSPTESIGGGSSSSVSGYGAGYAGTGESAFAGSSSNIGIQNSNFTAYNHDYSTSSGMQAPIEQPSVVSYVNDYSTTDTNTSGSAALESGGTQSFGGEYGGANFNASGSEYGTISENPNAGGDGGPDFGGHHD